MSDNNTQTPIDRLMEGARILGASRVIRDADASKVTRQQGEDLIAALDAYQARTGVSLSHIARCLGLSPSVISEVCSWHYKGDWQQIVLDLDRWLEDEHKTELTAKPAGFVLTKVAREMFTVAEAAIHLKGIGVVFGPSGVGKTLALRAIAAEKPGSVFVRLETLSATAAGVIDSVARALRVTWDSRGAVSTRIALLRIKAKLRDTPRLIIIDEIHKLCGQSSDTSLNALRDLHDATGCPMLWCGSTDLLAYLERETGPTREPLAQIRRRIVMCRDLTERTIRPDGGPGEPLYTVDEIRQMFGQGKLRLTPDAINDLMSLANLYDGGHLGACASLVAMATKVHEGTTNALTGEMLRSVLALMVNRRALIHLGERMGVDRPSPAAKARHG